jgi:hypothetical protein
MEFQTKVGKDDGSIENFNGGICDTPQQKSIHKSRKNLRVLLHKALET